METLRSNNITTRRGLSYKYYMTAREPGQEQRPALLFLHGFRDTATCWQSMLPDLLNSPYRLIFPDLLGHGCSSKPTDAASYAYHLMAQDMIEILDAEDVKLVIPVGHDHGAGLAQRIYNHHPDRTAALVTMNVAYSPPSGGKEFDLAAINEMSQKVFGYATFEYWNFLIAPDTARIMNANLDRVWDIPHADTFATMRHLYGEPNAMKNYLVDRAIPDIELKPYARSPAFKAEWKAIFAEGGLEAPLCWYTSHVHQVQSKSDSLIDKKNIEVRVPMLFIGCDGDAPCRAEMIEMPRRAGLLPDLTMHILEGVGHWPMYERPEETSRLLLQFLYNKTA